MPEGSNRAIVVVSSIRALGIRPGLAAYASTKAAVNQLVRMAAYELAAHGIRVNALSPGITVTPLVAESLKANPDILAERTADVPMGRPGQPDGHGQRCPLPVPAGVAVRHRHEHHRRRRRAPALRS